MHRPFRINWSDSQVVSLEFGRVISWLSDFMMEENLDSNNELRYENPVHDRVEVSFIGGGNRSTRRNPPTCRKSLTNLIT
jgi:hypothetical protein